MRRESLANRPSLDIASYGRRGPGRRDRLSPAEIEQISRTVRRAPEVVIKVLTRNATDLKSVEKHLDYIGRKGALELETDDGERVRGKGAGQDLAEDWDLDLEEHRRSAKLQSAEGRSPAKLVHKLILSMPPRTPAKGVLSAARNFLREEFALKHRYAFVLHTDEPHPHVHVVVKAISEQGQRLNISKSTLREWRREFARHLREQGIEANATERAVRGQVNGHKLDGIYRTVRDPNRDSTHHARQVASAMALLRSGHPEGSPGAASLRETRNAVGRGWRAVSESLMQQGESELAAAAWRFWERMPSPRTDQQRMAMAVQQRVNAREDRDPSRVR